MEDDLTPLFNLQREYVIASRLLLSDKLYGEIQQIDQPFSAMNKVISDINSEHDRLDSVNWPMYIAHEYGTSDIESVPAFTDAGMVLAGISTAELIGEVAGRLQILTLWLAKAVNNERFELAVKVKTARDNELLLLKAYVAYKGNDPRWFPVIAAQTVYYEHLLSAMTE